MVIDHNSTVQVSSNAISTEVDGEVFMMDITDGQYFGLDEIGCSIWGLLAEPISVAGLSEKLVEIYDIKDADHVSETIKFLQELADANLIVGSKTSS